MDYFLTFLFDIFAFFIRLLPLDLARKLVGESAYFLSFFFPEERDISVKQLKIIFPEISDQEAINIFRQSFAHLGQMIVEIIQSRKIIHKSNLIVDSSNVLDKHKNIPSLLVSAHVGSFEPLASYFNNTGGTAYAMGRLPNYPSFAMILKKIRKYLNVTTIWRDDKASAPLFLKALKDKQALAALIDQDVQIDSIFAPFFGIEASCPISPVKVALKHDLPIAVTLMVREADGSFRQDCYRIPYDKNSPTVHRDIMTAYNQRVESIIRDYPEQWLGWHRRWRTRPEGRLSKEEYLTWLDDRIADRQSHA